MTVPEGVVYATPAHRGRGVVHLARPIEARRDDPGLLTLATSALCGASTASSVFRGVRQRRAVRPGESIALDPSCGRCRDLAGSGELAYAPAGEVLPRTGATA